jgi:hypothetical protein
VSELSAPAVVRALLSISSICAAILGDPRSRDFVPLGAAILNPDLLAVDKLTHALGTATRCQITLMR